MDFFRDKKVWITGASTGLGSELARRLVLQGARVVVTARNKAALQGLAGETAGGRFLVLPGDMEGLETLRDLTIAAWEAFDGLDMVILNAGVSHRSLFTETSPEVQGRVLTVNLLSQMEIIRYLLPSMVDRKGGHIVSVTSLAGRVASPLRSCYAAAKHGLHGFFNSLRVETAGSGIRISLVVPGFLRTDISRHALAGDGSVWGRSDRNQLSGLCPEKAAERVLKALSRGKKEIYVGYPPRAALALFLGTRLPGLFDRILSRSDST